MVGGATGALPPLVVVPAGAPVVVVVLVPDGVPVVVVVFVPLSSFPSRLGSSVSDVVVPEEVLVVPD
jgi:hypothetical protein